MPVLVDGFARFLYSGSRFRHVDGSPAGTPPFDTLSDAERKTFLSASRETVQAIFDLGYIIQKKDDDPDSFQETGDPERVLSASYGRPTASRGSPRRRPPVHCLRAGREMLAAGEPLPAYDILSEGVEQLGGLSGLDDLAGSDRHLLITLLQQQALALAQSGAYEDANTILRALRDRGISDSETLGILGRTWKDMALATSDNARKTKCLREAFSCYNTAYESERQAGNHAAAYYTGINAAAVSLLGGNPGQSRLIAGQVREICRNILAEKKAGNEPVSFWLLASLGEASLLRGKHEEAGEWYAEAVAGAGGDIRALGTMRKQARLILAAAGRDPHEMDHCFPVPSVVLFSGHVIDAPGRRQRRFPPEKEEEVRRGIAAWLDEHNGQIGFASAACGSDILFLEEMLGRGGEINVVLPFAPEAFIWTSVRLFAGGNWEERFRKVLDRAAEVKVLSQYNELTLDDDLLFTNLYLYGTSQVRAERAGTDLRTLLVWDGNGAESIAGTAAFAELLREQGGRFDVIAPLQPGETGVVAGESGVKISGAAGTVVTVSGRQARHHTFLPLLIADVKGYSRLDKWEKMIFASAFMGEMAAVLTTYDDGILGRKTQGDSLFLVFRNLWDCVQCARALREKTLRIDWTGYGLSSQLTMRISLDAGPCYSYTDPITNLLDFCGDYVVRAARLEPVTPPGNIYASETFVAVARALGISDVPFDYAGQVELPKGYGRMQAFHVK